LFCVVGFDDESSIRFARRNLRKQRRSAPLCEIKSAKESLFLVIISRFFLSVLNRRFGFKLTLLNDFCSIQKTGHAAKTAGVWEIKRYARILQRRAVCCDELFPAFVLSLCTRINAQRGDH